MVRVVDPKGGERGYDPCCGIGGFLAQAAQHMSWKADAGDGLPAGMSAGAAKDVLKHATFYGRQKENLSYPTAFRLAGVEAAWYRSVRRAPHDQARIDDALRGP